MILHLARASLLRHRTRTALAILGVAVSAAMLLDMVMLASGMRESFRSLLVTQGFQLRLAPRGTGPFDTEATIAGAGELTRRLRAQPGVREVSPLLGSQLHLGLPTDDGAPRSLSAIAIGNEAAFQGDYNLLSGRVPSMPDECVVSDALLAAASLRIGDTLRAAGGFDPQLRAVVGERALVVVGRAHFIYLSATDRALSLPLATLQRIKGETSRDRVSLLMIRLREGTDVESLRRWIRDEMPTVTAISIQTMLEQVEARLTYFRQLAFILGSVSLVVGFLLVTTLVTVSVNERTGELAVMRAIGVARARIVRQILLESLAIMLVGSIVGLGLGLATARYLDSILATFPGLPEAIDFFLFQPRDAWTALALLAVCGVLAGAYPAWRGASLPIARTLREEAVG
jgi:putative ABC transport system permease protein